MSLTELFIERIEEMIFSGELKAGERMPSERELAEKMNVSQTVVNNGLSKLAERGLVKIAPRKGTFVVDYINEGGLITLASLVNYSHKHLPSELMRSMYEFRLSVEKSMLHRAAERMGEDEYAIIKEYLHDIENSQDTEKQTEIAFEMIQFISRQSSNEIYAMMTNGFKSLYYATFEKLFAVADVKEYVKHVSDMIKYMEGSHFKELDVALGNYQAYEFETLMRNGFFS